MPRRSTDTKDPLGLAHLVIPSAACQVTLDIITWQVICELFRSGANPAA